MLERALCREYIIFAKLARNPRRQWRQGWLCGRGEQERPTNQFSSSIKYLAFIVDDAVTCRLT